MPNNERTLLLGAIFLGTAFAVFSGCFTPEIVESPGGLSPGFDLSYGGLRAIHLGPMNVTDPHGIPGELEIVLVQLPPWIYGDSLTDPRSRTIVLGTTSDFASVLFDMWPCPMGAGIEDCADFQFVRWFENPQYWLFGTTHVLAETAADRANSTASIPYHLPHDLFYAPAHDVTMDGHLPSVIIVASEDGKEHVLEQKSVTHRTIALLDLTPAGAALPALVSAPDGRPPETNGDYLPFTFGEAWEVLSAEYDLPEEAGVPYASYLGMREVYLSYQHTTLERLWSWRIDVDGGAEQSQEYTITKRVRYLGQMVLGEPDHWVTPEGTHFDKEGFEMDPQRASLDASVTFGENLFGGAVTFVQIADPDQDPIQDRHTYRMMYNPREDQSTGPLQTVEIEAGTPALRWVVLPQDQVVSHFIRWDGVQTEAEKIGLWQA